MGYEKEVLARARSRYAEMVTQHRLLSRRRQEEVYRKLPEVAELDSRIRQTMAEVMAQTLRQGEDPVAALNAVREENLALQQRRRELLLREGYSPEDVQDGPMCRKCSDTGYVGEHMCTCLQRLCIEEQRKELTSLLRSPSSSFDDFSLDYYSQTTDPSLGVSPRAQMEIVYDACVNYARHFSLRSRNMLFTGGTGLGKTFLSGCIAQDVVESGYSVVYDTAIHVFSCMEKQKFGGGTEEELRMADRIMVCDLLILDDLGTEMSTSFISPALYSIVNGRILTQRPTIISTNLSMAELEKRYSPQIASRLAGEYITLMFLGQDIRRQKNR